LCVYERNFVIEVCFAVLDDERYLYALIEYQFISILSAHAEGMHLKLVELREWAITIKLSESVVEVNEWISV